jgi:phage gp36-like protein
MPQTLELSNFDEINLKERTRLASDTSGDDAVVESTQGFAASDYFVVGECGVEGAELAQVQTIASNTLDAQANFALSHLRGEPVVKLFGNQIRIWRAANVDGSVPADSSFTLVTTVDIDVDQPTTEYTDPTGGSSYWYKKTYHHSGTGAETALADAEAVRGGNYGHYVTLHEVVQEAFPGGIDYLSMQLVADARDAAEEEVNGLIAQRYTLPLPSVPKLIKKVTLLIAAGWLLSKVWSSGEEGTNKDGKDKRKEGREILKSIVSGDLTLLDLQQVAITGETTQIRGYPDSATPREQRRKFSMSMKF